MGCKPSKEKSEEDRRLSRAWTMPSTQSSPGARILHRLTSQRGSFREMVEKEEKQVQACDRCNSAIFEKNSEGLPLLLREDFGSSTLVWNRKEWLRMSAGVSAKVKKVFMSGLPLIYANPMVFGKLIKQNIWLPEGYHTQEEFDEFMSDYSDSFSYWSMDKEGWCIVMDKKMVEEGQAEAKEQVKRVRTSEAPVERVEEAREQVEPVGPREAEIERSRAMTFTEERLVSSVRRPDVPDEDLRPSNEDGTLSSSTVSSDLSQSSSISSSTSDEGPSSHFKGSSKLDQFQLLSPPGGSGTVVFYFTSLQGIRETHEECKSVKKVLDGLLISIDERDVLMHAEFKTELDNIFGKVKLPSVFIKGRYIGGADEILKLNELKELKELVEGMPKRKVNRCEVCGDERFIPCSVCNGSKKVFGSGKRFIRCEDCNENGLLRCPLCCNSYFVF